VYLTEQQMPQQLAAWLSSITNNPVAVLAILNVFFLLIGLFLHSAAAIILVVPIVMPLVNKVGIDPVHFGLIVTLNLGIGQQTPPVASVLMASLLDRQGRHVEGHAREPALHRRAAGHIAAGDLCAGRADGPGRILLPMTDTILCTRDGANPSIATVTLNRPDKLNAMTRPMWQALGRQHARTVGRRLGALRAAAWCRRESLLARQRHRRVRHRTQQLRAGQGLWRGAARRAGRDRRMPPPDRGPDRGHLRRWRAGDRRAVRLAHLR
jgi:hypothetical protein